MSTTALTRPVLFWEKAACENPEYFQSKGIKENRDKVFSISLAGSDLYQLLKLLVESAQSSSDFEKISKFVLFEDEMRRQLRSQGF